MVIYISQNKDLAKSIKRLSDSISKFDSETKKYNQVTTYLTLALLFFTLFQIILQVRDFLSSGKNFPLLDGAALILTIVMGALLANLALKRISFEDVKLTFSCKQIFWNFIILAIIIILTLLSLKIS